MKERKSINKQDYYSPIRNPISNERSQRDKIGSKPLQPSKSAKIIQYQQIEIDRLLELDKYQDHSKYKPEEKTFLFNSTKQNNKNIWESCIFESPSYKYGDLIPDLPTEKTEWNSDGIQPYYEKGFDTRGVILRTAETITLRGVNTLSHFSFTLEGSSTLWIVLRTLQKYTKHTVIIKFTKDKEKSQDCFISMGTFINDKNNSENKELLTYKEFQSQQLVQMSVEGNDKEYSENDRVDFRVTVEDTCINEVNCKVQINKSKEFNRMSCKYFLPYFDDSRVFVSGYGSSCNLKSIFTKSILNTNPREKADEANENDLNNPSNKKCDCCCMF